MAERIDTRFRRLIDRRRVRDRSRKETEAAEKAYAAAEAKLWSFLEDIGQETVTMDLGDGYGKVHFEKRKTIRSSVVDFDDFMKWANENAVTEEYTRSEAAKRQLNELVRGRVEKKQELPPGVSFNTTRYISIEERGKK